VGCDGGRQSAIQQLDLLRNEIRGLACFSGALSVFCRLHDISDPSVNSDAIPRSSNIWYWPQVCPAADGGIPTDRSAPLTALRVDKSRYVQCKLWRYVLGRNVPLHRFFKVICQAAISKPKKTRRRRLPAGHSTEPSRLQTRALNHHRLHRHVLVHAAVGGAHLLDGMNDFQAFDNPPEYRVTEAVG